MVHIVTEQASAVSSQDAVPPRGLKCVGYCLRCGGDCYDDGVRNFHNCPRKRPSAPAIARAKFACDKALVASEARPWAKNLSESEYGELKLALRELREALSALAPQPPG